MMTRQAKNLMGALLLFLGGFSACSPSNQATSIPTFTVPPLTAPPTHTAAPIPSPSSSPTSLACLTNPGRVEEGRLDSSSPPQAFRIYLPACYHEKTNERYPVLYLLHGQTYTDDQWIRLGAVQAADDLILSGESVPFIIVFPDDRYWNLPPGAGFGQRLIEVLIPHVDNTYRTLPGQNHRAIGGLSRGAGWALRLGLTRWDLFGTIGLHSLAVLQRDASEIREWLGDIPPASRPRVFMDIGDNDPEYEMAGQVEAQFTEFGLPHEWHLYTGAHTEEYWSSHVEEYLRWYIEAWNEQQ